MTEATTAGPGPHPAPDPAVRPSVTIDTSRPHPARVYDYLLVRHEALFDRAEVGDLRRRAVAAV